METFRARYERRLTELTSNIRPLIVALSQLAEEFADTSAPDVVDAILARIYKVRGFGLVVHCSAASYCVDLS